MPPCLCFGLLLALTTMFPTPVVNRHHSSKSRLVLATVIRIALPPLRLKRKIEPSPSITPARYAACVVVNDLALPVRHRAARAHLREQNIVLVVRPVLPPASNDSPHAWHVAIKRRRKSNRAPPIRDFDQQALEQNLRLSQRP